MVFVLTVPHSLPFRQPWLMTVSPPDVFTLSIVTLETQLHSQNERRFFATRRRFGLSKARADQRRRPFSTALHRLTLIPRMALNRASASFSAQSGEAFRSKSAIRNSFRSVSFDVFRPIWTAAFALSTAASRSRAPGLVAAAFGSIS
jgi:hypothetical protein